MKKKKVVWKSHPGPQTEALTRIELEVLYGGARGGGKTDAGMAWLLRHIDNPKYRALIIRRNADDLSDWVDRARTMYRDTGATFAYRPSVITFPSGAIFKTGHLKDDNAYGKYIGHEYHKMVVEELTQIPTEELYLKLISSCRSTVKGLKPQIFCTTNPGGIGHGWVKQRFVDVGESGKPYIDPKTKRDRIFIPAKVMDNPTLMEMNPEYLQFLDGLPDQLRKAWRDGDWDIIAGQVFTEWRRDSHVVEPFQVQTDWKRYISIDWGVNKASSVGWYAENYDGRIFLYRELYMNGNQFEKVFGQPLIPSRLAKVIKGLTKDDGDYEYCTADPSMWNKPEGGESIAETMLKEGLKLIPADNDRMNGLARVREILKKAPDGKPWLQVFSSCVDTIRTIPSLPYDLRKVEDVDTDAEDHCYDQMRYFLMSRPAKPSLPREPASLVRRAFLRRSGKLKDEDYESYRQQEQEWMES